MDIKLNELFVNFNNYLKSSWKYLRNVGIMRDTLDDWDDWVELSYDVLVLSKIQEYFGKQIELGYAFWPDDEEYESIEVNISSNTKILVAVDKNNFKEEILKENIIFSFREFNHPHLQEDDIIAFDYVYGEIIEDNIFPIGTVICAPFENCSFQLSEVDNADTTHNHR